MVSRRELLSFAAVGTLTGVLPLRSLAGVWHEEFRNAMAAEPWLRAFRSMVEPPGPAQAVVSGRWPAGLAGTLYRNGPARHEVGNFRYRHWFDGDGMVQAWRLSATGVRHQARMVNTHKLRAETAAGRALYPAFGSMPPDPAPVSSPDAVNPANISVLAHHGRLFALWEAGSAWEIDPDDLSTVGLHDFSEETAGLPFSAHPRVEPDGTVWNFGYASAPGLLVLWQIDPAGRVVRTGAIPVDPMTMPHDFVVTERHLVLLLPPLHFQPPADRATTFLDSHHWAPDQPTRVLVVRKDDFSTTRWFELPAQWVFHFGNAWEEPGGVIHFDAARAADPSAMFVTFREVMRGRHVDSPPTRHHRYRIDLRAGTAIEEPMFDAGFETEFPVIDPRVSTRRNHRLVFLCADRSAPAGHPLLNQVGVYDDRDERLSTYRYPDHQLPEEHLFVPAPGSAPERQGWVVGSALDVGADRMLLNVFDVTALDAGPIATATLPYALPFGLHGTFVAAPG